MLSIYKKPYVVYTFSKNKETVAVGVRETFQRLQNPYLKSNATDH